MLNLVDWNERLMHLILRYRDHTTMEKIKTQYYTLYGVELKGSVGNVVDQKLRDLVTTVMD